LLAVAVGCCLHQFVVPLLFVVSDLAVAVAVEFILLAVGCCFVVCCWLISC
jgi:hypothetical protein